MTKALTAGAEIDLIDHETASNDEAIADLANETHQPLSVVREIYDEVFARLKASARVHDYVVLFARRQTRDVLVKRRR